MAAKSTGIVKEGLLRKQGGTIQTWKDRWFVLTSVSLSYFEKKESDVPIKRILISEIKSADAIAASKSDNRKSTAPGAAAHFYFNVVTPDRIYTISARDERERQDWVDAIRSVTTAGKKGPEQPKEEVVEKPVERILPRVLERKERAPFKGQVLEREFPFETFVADLRSLVRSDVLSDLAFVVKDVRFHAHRAIVGARCAELAKQFPEDGGFKGAEVSITTTAPEHFSTLLDFLYTDTVSLTSANVVDVHNVAVTYRLPRLIEICTVFIREKISVDNVLTMLKAANRLCEFEIERFCLGYMADVARYQTVIRQKEATQIAQENKDLYIAMSQVLAQSPESFEHKFDSVSVSPSSLTRDIATLLETVKYADIRIFARDRELFAHKILVTKRCHILLEEGAPHGEDAATAASVAQGYTVLRFPTLDAHVVQNLLQYVYSNSIRVEYLEDAYGLIDLADRVQQDNIIGVCNEMMRNNLTGETALKILMVSSRYELIQLKKATLGLIVRESDKICGRKELRVVLGESPHNMIDIVRALVKGESGDFSDDQHEEDETADEDDD